MKPKVVAWELGKRLRDDICLVRQRHGGMWFERQMKVKRDQLYARSGTLATMANGLPYAVAAQISFIPS